VKETTMQNRGLTNYVLVAAALAPWPQSLHAQPNGISPGCIAVQAVSVGGNNTGMQFTNNCEATCVAFTPVVVGNGERRVGVWNAAAQYSLGGRAVVARGESIVAVWPFKEGTWQGVAEGPQPCPK
jgi:hypothetical protein